MTQCFRKYPTVHIKYGHVKFNFHYARLGAPWAGSSQKQKIQYFLKQEYNSHISVPKIYEILKEKYTVKSKWKKNQERGSIPEACKPREVIQMDTIDFGDLFAFTGIDIFTREADVLIAPELTAKYGGQFLTQSMKRRFNGFVHLIQTDGGPEFKDEFKKNVAGYCDRHHYHRPYMGIGMKPPLEKISENDCPISTEN